MLTVDDALRYAVWGPNLTQKVLTVIEDHAVQVFNDLYQYQPWAVQNCDLACEAWAKVFALNGTWYEIAYGHYSDDGDIIPLSADHTWMVVEGPGLVRWDGRNVNLFDPTGLQFGPDIDLNKYWLREGERYFVK